jgi:hypothetical protein
MTIQQEDKEEDDKKTQAGMVKYKLCLCHG